MYVNHGQFGNGHMGGAILVTTMARRQGTGLSPCHGEVSMHQGTRCSKGRIRRQAIIMSASTAGVVLALFATGPAAALQEPATEPEIAVQGLVLHEITFAPVVGAAVSIPALGLEALTLEDGSFRFVEGVAGIHHLRVSAPGYVTLVEQFEVAEEGFAYVQVLLPSLDAVLGAITVRGRMAGRAVTGGDATGSALDLLRSVAGLRMFGQTGNRGQARGGVTLRGVTSITQSSAPQVVLDGVRIGQGDNVADILSQIPASHIRDIQVLPGPSAGFDEVGFGANGVIRIRTRTGPH